MAYRGRVLVALSTQLDGKIDKNVDDICSDDILVAQVCNVWKAVSLSALLWCPTHVSLVLLKVSSC